MVHVKRTVTSLRIHCTRRTHKTFSGYDRPHFLHSRTYCIRIGPQGICNKRGFTVKQFRLDSTLIFTHTDSNTHILENKHTASNAHILKETTAHYGHELEENSKMRRYAVLNSFRVIQPSRSESEFANKVSRWW